MIPHLLIDGYKLGHAEQYPKDVTLIFSNFTPRKSRRGMTHIVFFGLQYFIKKYLIEEWKAKFFDVSKKKAIGQYRDLLTNYIDESLIKTEKLEALHDLGYLPLEIHALPEGSLVNIGVPAVVMWNNHPEHAWLVNYMETLMSAILWPMCTSATTAYEYRKILDAYAKKTSSDEGFVDYQAHDFSFRGMFGLEAAMMSGAAHLLCFKGSDTIPAISFIRQYYNYNNAPNNLLFPACTVPATEHSVMCAGGKDNELGTFKRLITEVYPSGIVSIVSDTWDFWNVITNYARELKDIILTREGRVVFRPDSGHPTEIICGNLGNNRGAIDVLWDIFGGTVNEKGYKELDPHVGLIYGDSITIEICEEICKRLEEKGYASTNVVFGVGSFTYQHVTRDTDGWAMKATYLENDSTGPMSLFKDPVTDDGTKRSAKGLLAVYETENGFELKQEATWEEVKDCALIPYLSGICNKKYFYNVSNSFPAMRSDNFPSIRNRLHKGK